MSSISSQESAALASDSKEPECEPSHSARSMLIADMSSRRTGRRSPATRTSEPLPLIALEQTELFPTSSAAASRAKMSALRDPAPVLRVRAADYGQSTPDLLANFDLKSSSWRTSQRSLIEDWTEFSGTWPRSGLMRNGTAYRLPPLAPLTDAIASGSWPTPTVKGNYNKAGLSSKSGDGLSTAVQRWPTPTASDARKGYASPPGQANDRGRETLSGAVHAFKTPTAAPWSHGGSGGELHKQVAPGGGPLNPTWVEWLMGFPLGWTVLPPSETPSSRKSRSGSGSASSKERRR